FLIYVPVNRPRLCRLAFALLLGVGSVGACSVDDADMAASTCSGLSCRELGPPTTPQEVLPTLSGAPDAATPPPLAPAKEACGAGSCLPDNASDCLDYVPPEPPGGGGADAGVELDAGAPEGASDAGLILDAGAADPAIDGSFSQPTPERGPARFACQLGVTGETVTRACGAAGSQQLEQACTSTLDCAPGLGCVGSARSGRCLPYCCGVGADSCAPGFYCAERPLRSEALGESDGPLVPVCDRADNCSLGEAEDCVGERCVCGPDMACTLVRPDGTTSCVKLPPSPGHAGEPCPCDRGYHCSQATEPATCVKTCDLDEEDSDTCGSGVCQATPVLPEGWGICVGATADQMTPPSP
ncbi:MAG TPA: hypothetical protein VNN80_09700, partial [Polyangiaceae bacterium]|nr:hypothetical protein [Polyangiaceae bacterium]